MKSIRKYFVVFYIAFIFIFISNIIITYANERDLEFTPQVPIPGDSDFSGGVVQITGTDGTELIARYIGEVYRYGVSIGAILAAVVLMGAGLLWLTSGGSQQKIGKAKELITGSIVGLFLLFGSYMILNLINPALVKLRVAEIEAVPALISGCCQLSGSAEMMYSTTCEEEEGELFQDRVVSGNSCVLAQCCEVYTRRGFGTARRTGYFFSGQCETNYITKMGYSGRAQVSSNRENCKQEYINCINLDGVKCFDMSRSHWSRTDLTCNDRGICGWCLNGVCVNKWANTGEPCGNGDGRCVQFTSLPDDDRTAITHAYVNNDFDSLPSYVIAGGLPCLNSFFHDRDYTNISSWMICSSAIN